MKGCSVGSFCGVCLWILVNKKINKIVDWTMKRCENIFGIFLNETNNFLGKESVIK